MHFLCILPKFLQDKWEAIANLKKDSKSAPVPVKGDEAKKYKAKSFLYLALSSDQE